MLKDFVEASKTLSVYGKQAEKVFLGLAQQAKAANVEVSALMGITAKFDSFSDGAMAAGQLNAVLGTSLDVNQMLMVSDEKRLEILRQNLRTQGIFIKDMDKYTQRAVAGILGINDLSEAQRILDTTTQDLRKSQLAAANEKEFNKRLSDTLAITEKMEMAFKTLFIQMGWLLEWFEGALQSFIEFNESTGGLGIKLVLLAVTVTALALAMAKLAPLLSLIGVGLPAAGGGFAALGAGLLAGAKGFAIGGAALLVLGLALSVIFGAFALIPAGGLLSIGEGLFKIGVGLLAVMVGAVGVGVFTAFATTLLWLGTTLATVNLEKLQALADIMNNLSGMTVKVKVWTDLKGWTKQLAKDAADLKPILGDMALIAAGTNSAGDITNNTAATNIANFAANFENVFKPQVTVLVGGKEFEARVLELSNE